jgi:hypothetical protein
MRSLGWMVFIASYMQARRGEQPVLLWLALASTVYYQLTRQETKLLQEQVSLSVRKLSLAFIQNTGAVPTQQRILLVVCRGFSCEHLYFVRF